MSFLILGVSFKTLLAMQIAQGQKFAVTHLVHLLAVCITMVLASSCSSQIICSASPFWWCAFTPAKVSGWPFFWQSMTPFLAWKMLLPEWYDRMWMPRSRGYFQTVIFVGSRIILQVSEAETQDLVKIDRCVYVALGIQDPCHLGDYPWGQQYQLVE